MTKIRLRQMLTNRKIAVLIPGQKNVFLVITKQDATGCTWYMCLHLREANGVEIKTARNSPI